MGQRWEFLFRGSLQLGLAGCGYTVAGNNQSPAEGGTTVSVVASPLFRVHLGSSVWVLDLGPQGGVVTTGTLNGTVALALIEAMIETGVVFGDHEEWEILLQVPVGFMFNGSGFCLEAKPGCVDGFVFTPALALVYGF